MAGGADPVSFPPPQENESWWMCNCTRATCKYNNTVELVKVKCEPPPMPTCTNGLAPVRVEDPDKCCWHWECDCKPDARGPPPAPRGCCRPQAVVLALVAGCPRRVRPPSGAVSPASCWLLLSARVQERPGLAWGRVATAESGAQRRRRDRSWAAVGRGARALSGPDALSAPGTRLQGLPQFLLALPTRALSMSCPRPAPSWGCGAGSPHFLRRLLHGLGGPTLRHLRRALLQLPGQLHVRAGGGDQPPGGQLRDLCRQLPLRRQRQGVLPPHAHRAPRDPGGSDQDRANDAHRGAGALAGRASSRSGRLGCPRPRARLGEVL